MPAARAASGGRPRVTVRVISAVWYSRSRSISIRFFATSASIRSVSPGPRFSWTPDWGRLPRQRRCP